MTNTLKLKGRIIEEGFNLTTFADAIDMTPPSLRAKINGRSEFKASEIKKVCDILAIPMADIPSYFFTDNVSNQETERS